MPSLVGPPCNDALMTVVRVCVCVCVCVCVRVQINGLRSVYCLYCVKTVDKRRKSMHITNEMSKRNVKAESPDTLLGTPHTTLLGEWLVKNKFKKGLETTAKAKKQ